MRIRSYTFNRAALLLLLIGIITHYTFSAKLQIWSDLILVAAVFCHSTKLWGVKNTITYIALAMIIGYVAEFIGINTSLIFGSYHYNPKNVGMLFGVPIFVPVLYATLLYAGNFICIAISKNLIKKKNLWVLALMSGFVLMLKDIVTDPLQSTVMNFWIWNNGGEYFGVPVHNFIGWFAVFAVMTFVTLWFTWHKNNASDKISINRHVLYFPVLLFFGFALFGLTSALNTPTEFRDIAHFCAYAAVFFLGPYLLLAWFNGLRKD